MTKFLDGLKKDEQGLTLIELLAVVVILAIVAAIAFVLIGNVIENSKKDAAVSDALQMISAAKLYEATGNVIETNGVGNDVLKGEELMGDLIDPWTKATTVTGTVTKNNSIYSVTLDSSGCEIVAEEEAELLKEGRGACN